MSALETHYSEVYVDQFIVMPNHVHAIIVIGEQNQISKMVTLPQIIGSYKSGVSKQIHQLNPDLSVWKRAFHDHIIRNQIENKKIWNYVAYNDLKWEEDCFYPTQK